LFKILSIFASARMWGGPIPTGVSAMLAVFIPLLRRSTIQFTSPMAFPGAFLLK